MFSPYPYPPTPVEFERVATVLDPVLSPLGFAPGQAGGDQQGGQVVFCRGLVDSVDGGCVDLVIDLGATPDRRITDVRYWGFPSERWHLEFARDAPMSEQLEALARTLPVALAHPRP